MSKKQNDGLTFEDIFGKISQDVSADEFVKTVLGEVVLNGLIGLENTLKEIREKTEQKINNTEENNKQEQPEAKAKAVGIYIKDCDLTKEEDSICGLKFNAIKIDSKGKEVFFEISVSGFGENDVITKSIKTARDEYGKRIAKVLHIEMNRNFEFENNDFVIQQLPNYLNVEFAFFGAKRIDKIFLRNGLLQVLVQY